jgi:cation diffusion facilitator family transporter
MNPIIRLPLQLLSVGFMLLAVKIYAYSSTHSIAILSDVLESSVHLLAGALTIFSVWYARQPRDASHPYGHGKIEFISAAFEGLLMAITALGIVYQAVMHLAEGKMPEQLSLGLALTLGAGMVNGAIGLVYKRLGKRQLSVAFTAEGEHLLSDFYTSVGVTVGLGLVLWTGIPWIDPAIGLVMGGIVGYQSFSVLRKALAGLMDAADVHVLEKVVATLDAQRKKDWIDVHHFRLVHYGGQFHVDAHLTLPHYWDLQRVHDEVDAMEDLISSTFEHEVEFSVHADPCVPDSCSLCQVADCGVRTQAFERTIAWTVDNVLVNGKHSLTRTDL